MFFYLSLTLLIVTILLPALLPDTGTLNCATTVFVSRLFNKLSILTVLDSETTTMYIVKKGGALQLIFG